MNIGPPRRIIEVEPVTLPIPEQIPDPELVPEQIPDPELVPEQIPDPELVPEEPSGALGAERPTG